MSKSSPRSHLSVHGLHRPRFGPHAFGIFTSCGWRTQHFQCVDPHIINTLVPKLFNLSIHDLSNADQVVLEWQAVSSICFRFVDAIDKQWSHSVVSKHRKSNVERRREFSVDLGITIDDLLIEKLGHGPAVYAESLAHESKDAWKFGCLRGIEVVRRYYEEINRKLKDHFDQGNVMCKSVSMSIT